MSLILLLSPALALPFGPDLPSCEEFSPTAPGAVVVDETCQSEPFIGSFDPVIEWQWQGNTQHSGYQDVMTPPIVANLTDDNGDGVIDDLDVPDVLFVAHTSGGWSYSSALTLLSGDGSGEHWSLLGVDGYTFSGGTGVAVGDIDADGSPDICLSSLNAAVLCLEHDGTLKWASGTRLNGYGAVFPSIADMDGDGQAEVVVGSSVYDTDGTHLSTGAYGSGDLGGFGALSVVVDMDDDGDMEVVTGDTVYEMDGTVVWHNSNGEGYPAIGDFDGDGLPEHVKSGNGYVTLSDTDGTALWSTLHPGGGRGGPPTVADFDGDDQPEVGVAGSYAYTVFDTDGAVLWSQSTIDTTSNITGSSVFDFEGDGTAEVVYADEYNLFIYDGVTGTVLLTEALHDSATWFEYPVIADVDGDGSSEILLPSNRYRTANDWGGITVIGDANDSWVNSRPIWNQHSYHITNVNNDGSIPAREQPNWLTHNSFRAGGLESGPSDWWVDLKLVNAEGCLEDCSAPAVSVYLEASNPGLADLTDGWLSFYRYEDNALTEVHSEAFGALVSGDALAVGPISFTAEQWGDGDLWVELSTASSDCTPDDTLQNLGPWPYPDMDADGDGHLPPECGGDDCDDNDGFTAPGAPETPYDGVDNDCDDSTPDDDLDQDGFGVAEDCDDSDAAVNPDAEEIDDNGVDDDCDGQADIETEVEPLECEDCKAGIASGGRGFTCSSAPGGALPGVALALGLLVALRRRR